MEENFAQMLMAVASLPLVIWTQPSDLTLLLSFRRRS